jgi:multiple sugar transport system permease protein
MTDTATAPGRVTHSDRPQELTHAPRPGFLSASLFTGPYLVVFGLFLGWPLIYGLYMSFTNQSLTGRGSSLAGVSNYAEAFTDPMMWRTIGNTLFFTAITTIPLVIVSLVVALLVATGLPGQWWWRLSFFAPYMLASAVVAALWGWLYQPGGGLATTAMGWIGFDKVGWLTDERLAMWSVAITTVWWTLGFNFLLYLSAIQAIPEQLYEAASLDGASPMRRLRSITLPLLGKTTGLVVILQILASLKVFDQIYLMTQGGPNNSTRSALEYVYDVGFTGYRLGYAAAISFIFFLLILLFSAGQLLVARRDR